MPKKLSLTIWKAVQIDGVWMITKANGSRVAKLMGRANNERTANIIAASPYMLDSLRSLLDLIGEEDLPDKGELSGAAISDMARLAVSLALGKGDEIW
jgi:hypothetical protein